MNPEKQNPYPLVPFRLGERLNVGGKHSEIYRIEENDDVLVKKLQISDMNEEGYYTERKPSYSEQEFRAHYQKTLDILKKNLEHYLPDMQLVYGQANVGEPSGYLITEKVISETEPNEQKLELLDEFLSETVKMFSKQQGEKRYIPEVWNEENIRFGHTPKNPEVKYYLLDVYPLFKLDKDNITEKISLIFKKYPQFGFPKTKSALESII